MPPIIRAAAAFVACIAGLDGIVVYTNPAFSLPALLAGQSGTAHECVAALRAAGNAVVDWRHVEGFPVRSVVSDTLFFRAADQILLIGIPDVTELIWTAEPEPH